MKIIIRIVALIALLGTGCLPASSTLSAASEISAKADFYVAADGNDRWSGTSSVANAESSDGPFATLARARDAVRNLKKRQSTDLVVLVREGTYRLEETVVFGLEDSGEGDSTVTYAAYPGESPVFSSGLEITEWEKVSAKLPGLPKESHGKVWVADVSQRFYTLYDGKGMLPRARSAGFIPLPGGKRDTLHFPTGKLKNWSNLEDVEIVVRPHHAWIVNVLPLVSVDEEAQVARTAIPATYAMNELHFLKDTESCWVENVLEELDEPGEWVLNTKEGKLYLWPRDEGAPQGIVAPGLRELLRVEGSIDKDGPTGPAGAESVLPRPDVHAWRSLSADRGRRGPAARLGDARPGQRPGSPTRRRELHHRAMSLCPQRRRRDSSGSARAGEHDLRQPHRAYRGHRHPAVRLRPGNQRREQEQSRLQQPHPPYGRRSIRIRPAS